MTKYNTTGRQKANRGWPQKAGSIFMTLFLLSGLILNSCQKEFEIIVSDGEPISLSASATELELTQELFASSAVNLIWTRGSNQGTGSPISYTLQLDIAGNNFASALSYEMGMAVYEKNFTGGELNDLLTDTYGVAAGSSATIEARVIADIYDESVEDDISESVSISVTTFEPVSEVLYLLGSATLAGDDIINALEMKPSADKPWIFIYEDMLLNGDFLLSLTRDDCWCKDFLTRDPSDEEMMIYNVGGIGDDNRWMIPEDGYYKVTANLIDLTIQIEAASLSPYNALYIVGDASPSGWDIATPKAFTQSLEDPNVFTFEGAFTPGEFKISTFTGDWCDDDWLNPSQASQDISATDFIITSGCDGPDNKWIITEENQGRYKITVNLETNTISIAMVKMYLIGDGGPNGWDIATPDSMTYADGIYTFTGELGADNPTGEFKFSKFTGNWCDGDWILGVMKDQPISNTSFSYYTGCPPDEGDFKWRLADGDAGNYVITFDLDAEEMTITKL